MRTGSSLLTFGPPREHVAQVGDPVLRVDIADDGRPLLLPEEPRARRQPNLREAQRRHPPPYHITLKGKGENDEIRVGGARSRFAAIELLRRRLGGKGLPPLG